MTDMHREGFDSAMSGAHKHQWHAAPPSEDGDFFYTGETPDGSRVTAIVQICTDFGGARIAYLFIPQNWRRDAFRKLPTMHYGELEKWRGEWSGPEQGLCCVTQGAALRYRDEQEKQA